MSRPESEQSPYTKKQVLAAAKAYNVDKAATGMGQHPVTLVYKSRADGQEVQQHFLTKALAVIHAGELGLHPQEYEIRNV